MSGKLPTTFKKILWDLYIADTSGDEKTKEEILNILYEAYLNKRYVKTDV